MVNNRLVLLAPLDLYPFVGTLISSWLKAIGTALYLHRPYFASKKMTEHQIAVFVEERKWHYRGSFAFSPRLPIYISPDRYSLWIHSVTT